MAANATATIATTTITVADHDDLPENGGRRYASTNITSKSKMDADRRTPAQQQRRRQ
jgi:hypothetical protein